MTKTTTVASKAFVAIVAAAMVFTLAAPAAKAQTVEQLQAQFTALMAQFTALLGSTTPVLTTGGNCAAIPAPLTMNASGASVTALQNFLISSGQSIPAGATGFFGAQTRSAVAAWQTANGVMPAVGYYGPVTAAAMAAKCVPVAPTTPTTPGTGTETGTGTTTPTTPGGSTTLGDDEGSLENFDEVSSDDSQVEEGQTNEIFAFTAEVEGDVEVDRVDFYLENIALGAQSDNADDYFQGAMLMVDGEEVATLDVDDFDEDSYTYSVSVVGAGDEYRLRFAGLGLVFADGDKPEFTLAFEGNTSLDTTDLTETWGVDLLDDSVRFVDGKGFSDSTGANLGETFGFDAEEVAELDVTEADGNPDAKTLEVDDTDDSDQITVLALDVEEKNGLDTTVEDMTFTITTLGTLDESAVVAEAILFNGSTKLGSESVPTGGVIEFENLGLEIDADTTADLSLKLVFKGSEDYNEGDTVTAVFTSIDKAKDENGNDEGDMTISGSADGNTHTLRSVGISVDITENTTTIIAEDLANNDRAEFVWEFEVTAFGNDDVYINKDILGIVATQVAADVDQVFAITYSSGAALTAVNGTITTNTDADDVTADATAYAGAYAGETFYKIKGGTAEKFTITVTGTNQTNSKQVQAALSAIEWTTDKVTAATAEDASVAAINSYSDNLLDDSETPFKSIN